MAKKFSQIKSTRGKRGRVWTSKPAGLPRYYFGGDRAWVDAVGVVPWVTLCSILASLGSRQ